jgi:hypothetical protein
MKSAIFMDGRKFAESEFSSEEVFEKIVKAQSKTLFGTKTIYCDIKSKIDTRFSGSTIPDGFLFDFKNEKNPDFYLVEVELQKHDFEGHILPQINRFFNSLNYLAGRNKLVDSLFSFVNSNSEVEQEFRQYLGMKEIYKALKDIIEKSQNILLVLDDIKPELQETLERSIDWKNVKVEVLKQYTADGKTIFTMDPDFDKIGSLEKTPKSRQTDIPESELLDLNETNFLAVVSKLGGSDVTTSQMLKHFKIIHLPKSKRRYGKLRQMAKKLAEGENAKITIDPREKRDEFKITLKP